jgi:hypothetical protein
MEDAVMLTSEDNHVVEVLFNFFTSPAPETIVKRSIRCLIISFIIFPVTVDLLPGNSSDKKEALGTEPYLPSRTSPCCKGRTFITWALLPLQKKIHPSILEEEFIL